MRDKGGLFFFLKIFLIILAVLLVSVAGAGFYVYKIYTFKTVRVCVSEVNAIDTNIPCSSQDYCITKAKESGILGDLSKTEDMPVFLKEKVEDVFNSVFVCDGTCKIKNLCGEQIGKACPDPNACAFGENEIKAGLHGQELLQLMGFAKKHPELIGNNKII